MNGSELAITAILLGTLIGVNIFCLLLVKGEIQKAKDEIIDQQNQLNYLLKKLLGINSYK